MPSGNYTDQPSKIGGIAANERRFHLAFVFLFFFATKMPNNNLIYNSKSKNLPKQFMHTLTIPNVIVLFQVGSIFMQLCLILIQIPRWKKNWRFFFPLFLFLESRRISFEIRFITEHIIHKHISTNPKDNISNCWLHCTFIK